MPDNPRIEQLRRRVQQDPTSIAFAQLAEEHRRAGEFEDAVRVSRGGLDLHPGYLSARVTLGRALIALGRFDAASQELEAVLIAAPDNLAATRALGDLRQRRETPPREPAPRASTTPATEFDLAFRASDRQFAQALVSLDALPLDLPVPHMPVSATMEVPAALSAASADPALVELESWLAAIVADRESRA